MQPRRPDQSHFAKVLVHAPAGRGKTTLLGTAQEDERTFPMAFLNFEGGESSLAGLDIDVFDIKNSKQFDEVLKDLQHKDAPWKSVGIDSLTEVQISELLDTLGGNAKRADPDLLAQADWGIVLIRLRRIVRKYVKNLPMHVFMTALSKDDVMPRIGQVQTPAIQGSFADELPGIPDVVSYLAEEDILDDAGKPTYNLDGTPAIRRILLLHSYPKFCVKIRTGWDKPLPPAEIEEPTVTKLLDAMNIE